MPARYSRVSPAVRDSLGNGLARGFGPPLAPSRSRSRVAYESSFRRSNVQVNRRAQRVRFNLGLDGPFSVGSNALAVRELLRHLWCSGLRVALQNETESAQRPIRVLH